MTDQANTQATSFDSILPKGSLLDTLSKLGFTEPTEIQSSAVPKALEGHDLILKAQTGSGKTLAFVLPFLERFDHIVEGRGDTTAALFIAPTRELAVQIQEVLQELRSDLSPVLVIGGVDEQKQKTALKKDPRIIVGTPGRLLDLLQRKIFSLKHCQYFVLDEADEMLSMGFIEDVRAILSKLPKKRQGLFVSATISPRVEMLANSFLEKAEYINVDVEDSEKPAIQHLYCEIGGDLLAKPHALCDIIETQQPRSAIIFCNTKSDTQFVEVLLRRRGFDARRMNSDLSQSQRQKVIAKIKAEDLHLLVATDIAARGIDIEELDLVINYSLHDQPDAYIHRTGRTGRAGLKGRAISLVGPRDFGSFHYLTKALDLSFEKLELPTDEEVADARLVHVYKMLRENEAKLDTRAMLSAKKLLRDNGCLEHANEDLIEVLGRLCEFTLAHSVAEEARSLDEELEAASRERPESDSRERGKGRNDRKRDRNDSSTDSKQNSRKRQDDDAPSERSSKHPSKERPKRNDETRTEVERVRMYVGQGSEHGMNEEMFGTLAKDLAEIDSGDLDRFSLREHYAFVDTTLPVAEKLLETLNGIQHNGESLTVEIASKFEPPRRRSSDNRGRRRGGNSRDGRNNGRNNSSRSNRRRSKEG